MVKLNYNELCQLLLDKTTALMNEYRECTRDLQPPVMLDKVAVIAKCRLSIANDMDDDLEAMLIPQHNGSFIIRYSNNNKFSMERKRMSIAHEVGHRLLYGTNQDSSPKIMYSARSHIELEKACFYAGRQILLPDFLLDPYLKANNECKEISHFVNLIEEICHTFDVSHNVAVRRILRDKSYGYDFGVLECKVNWDYFQYNLFENEMADQKLITKFNPIWGARFNNIRMRTKLKDIASDIIILALKNGKLNQAYKFDRISVDSFVKTHSDKITIYLKKSNYNSHLQAQYLHKGLFLQR